MIDEMSKSATASDGRTGVFLGMRRRAAQFRTLLRDRSGASAIEFAFLAPVLIAIYISCFEITTGYSVSHKVVKAAAAVGDIVTRQDSVDKAFLSEMVDVAEATIAPSPAPELKLKVTGVTIDAAGNAKVLWSWDESGGEPYAKGAAVDVPGNIKHPNSFLVHSEVQIKHTVLLFFGSAENLDSSARAVTLDREYFFRQRVGDDVPCSDCG